MDAPIIYELREAHPEVLCRVANTMNNELSQGYQHPGNSAELQKKQAYEQAVKELLKCAKKEILYQSGIIRRPEVTKVFTESGDAVMTEHVYNSVVPGIFAGRQVVPMYAGLPQEALLVGRAEAGCKDPFYEFLQRDAVDYGVDAISKNGPGCGEAGILKAGITHESEGAQVGSFGEKLADRGFEVRKVRPSGFWDETKLALQNLGVDLYRPGTVM